MLDKPVPINVDVSSDPINVSEALAYVSQPAYGGINTFIGTVRDFNQGRNVVGISYDIFKPLGVKTFQRIAAQAQATYGTSHIYVRHAHGRLNVGDVAVIVAVGTRHRDEAFRACRDVIEAVKHTAPIWKQEHYEDGDSAWTDGCALCSDGHTHSPGHNHSE